MSKDIIREQFKAMGEVNIPKRCEIINCKNKAVILDNGTYGAGHICRKCFYAIKEDYEQRHNKRG